jgi:L-lactate utilization protein LutC
MSFFKKLFSKTSSKEQEAKKQEVHLSLDDAFVHHFIEKGGKFLYCVSATEVATNLNHILKENNWKKITCIDPQIKSYLKGKQAKVVSDFNTSVPFFTSCEHLISDNGDILFSSNQLSTHKIASLTDDFIVFAKTSQLVKDTGQGLTGIKSNCKDNIPTNISAVKNYTPKKDDDSFLNYGNSNSKNLYLLLLEDL